MRPSGLQIPRRPPPDSIDSIQDVATALTNVEGSAHGARGRGQEAPLPGEQHGWPTTTDPSLRRRRRGEGPRPARSPVAGPAGARCGPLARAGAASDGDNIATGTPSTPALPPPRGPSPQCSAPSCADCCEEVAALLSSWSRQVGPRASRLASETTAGVGSRAIAEVALLCKQRALLIKAWPGCASTTEALPSAKAPRASEATAGADGAGCCRASRRKEVG